MEYGIQSLGGGSYILDRRNKIDSVIKRYNICYFLSLPPCYDPVPPVPAHLVYKTSYASDTIGNS